MAYGDNPAMLTMDHVKQLRQVCIDNSGESEAVALEMFRYYLGQDANDVRRDILKIKKEDPAERIIARLKNASLKEGALQVPAAPAPTQPLVRRAAF